MASLKNGKRKKKKNTEVSRYNQVELSHHHKVWIGNSGVRGKICLITNLMNGENNPQEMVIFMLLINVYASQTMRYLYFLKIIVSV